MSGLFNEAITPCPSRFGSLGFSGHSESETFDSLLDGDSPLESTEQIEFTTEIRPPTLTSVRPRRANRTGSAFQILEDVAGNPAGPVEKRRRPNEAVKAPDRKSSLLAQPAQRFRPKSSVAPSPTRAVKQKIETQPKSRGFESKTSKEKTQIPHRNDGTLDQDDQKAGLKKHLRRNTVYIPPDDTTASVFMGLFSPLKKAHADSMPIAAEDTMTNTLEQRIAQRQVRKSAVVSARKAPLQPSAKIAQEATFRVDIAGKNGGKENIPPGMLVDEKEITKLGSPSKRNRVSTMSVSEPVRPNVARPTSKPVSSRIVTQSPKQRSLARPLGEKQGNAKLSPLRSASNLLPLAGSRQPVMSASLNARASALLDRLSRSKANRPSKIQNGPPRLKELDHKYPALSDDIAKPALYGDNWLSHQETVITQLVNALFECANGDSTMSYDPNGLRLELLELYHTDEFTRLYKRLQSSLSFGNLSISKDLLARSNRLRHDIGLKRKFLDIWLNSYDSHALIAAVETVTGRKVLNDCIPFQHGSGDSQGSADKCSKVVLKRLEGFLEAFLVRNDDIGHSSQNAIDTSETHAKGYRRTVLRSIILVVLLDRGRQCPGVSLPRRLFLSSSTFKSSAKVLQALARVLLPSCGDITKQLSHLDCRLFFKQHELLEYNYQIKNIAVDLRDGVRLTRLVEILFFTSGRVQSDPDQTEVTLNTGEALSLLGDERNLLLSKHLKFPCVSRATKIFNVQIALSVLSSVAASTKSFDDIRAEDIVDGYREKTMALLWALVGKCGLASLVDWDEVGKEIRRLKKKALSQIGHQQAQTKAWFTGKIFDHTDEHTSMLQQWTAVLAALKGLEISNMTTSFVDGKIYQSIVDEYEPYIIGSSHRGLRTTTQPGSQSLEMRLRLLGCSSQFGKWPDNLLS